MRLTEEQKAKVARWIEEGLQPFDIQKRLEEEFGLRLTYLEVKLLLSDLNLTPKDTKLATTPQPQQPDLSRASTTTKKVVVSVDDVARPGAYYSGRVKFSDGKEAIWYIDQLGRLGLVPPEPGYRPSSEDLAQFQEELDEVLRNMRY